jgi:hypothetical protein
MTKKNDTPQDDFPKLSAPARRALAGAGFTRLDQLVNATESQLMALHGFGSNGLKQLREALAARELSFKTEK